MKTISTSELVAGMILAEDVATLKMNKLLDKGTVLTNKDIAKLLFYSIPSVSIGMIQSRRSNHKSLYQRGLLLLSV